MPNYLSEMLPAPDKLDELFPYIGGLIAYHRRSAYAHGQRRATLLAGISVPANFAVCVSQVFTSFPDASQVERTGPAINLHLLRLIANDELADARGVIAPCLGIEELHQTASSLVELDAVDPEIVTALLELRCGRAALLLKERASAPGSDPSFGYDFAYYKSLIEDIARVRIAYCLRGEAMMAAAQIHSPFNWSALDDLDKAKGAGSLRLFTLMAELKHNLRLFQHALQLYKKASYKPIVSGLLVYSPITGRERIAVNFSGLNSPVKTAAFDNLDIEVRARVQLALWRAAHGEQLESILATTLDQIGEYVANLEKGLANLQANSSPNNIVGNLNRANAGARLYEAAAEAIAWTADPIPQKGDDEYWEDTASLDAHLNPLAIAIEAVMQSSRDRAIVISVPASRNGHKEAVAELFMAMRLAFLQDDEALPLKLREVEDPSTGTRRSFKFHGRVAAIRGRKYTFKQQWEAYKEQEADKRGRLKPDATPKQRWEAERCRSDASRGTDPSRRPGGVRPRGFYQSRDALRGATIQGFVAR